MTFELFTWPRWEGPDSRVLPHDGCIEPDDMEALGEAGWSPIDYRSLPSGTMPERATAILHWLEGVRLGTITPQPAQAKFIELEMRACGLHTGKTTGSKPKNSLEQNPGDLASLLDFDGRE